jgi:DNA polymerase III alpha subunit|tara:strand:- start:8812 stop:9588 length:777 start_codon:yes stop_codon:yes gene_type:complete
MDVVPLFKSQYSIGRSILTLEEESSSDKSGPDSIFDICADNDLDTFFLVDDSMSGFLQAYVNSKKSNLKMIFGLRIPVCPDLDQKNSESLDKTCKYIILAKNTNGYKRLIKLFSQSSLKGFYYTARADFKLISSIWDDDDLQLAVPFYDSFIHKNHLHGSWCPEPPSDFSLDLIVEQNSLPFDHLIRNRISEYAKNNKKCTLVKAQSIYYKNKADFKPYITFRAIDKRTTLGKPNLEHMGSNEFCFESWQEKNNGKTP